MSDNGEAYREVNSREPRVIHISSVSTGHYLRYDGDNVAIRLAYDTAVPFVSHWTSHTEDDTQRYVYVGRRYDTMKTEHIAQSSSYRIATEGGSIADFTVLCLVM
jgi:hypothetical protein